MHSLQSFVKVFHPIWTIFILLVFLGIIAWVFSSKRKQHFEEAGRIPLDDDDKL